jgi:hypothetical protein
MGSGRWRFASGGVVVCLLSFPFASAAQDEDTYERENYVLAPDGTLLVITQPVDDESGLVRRSSGGADSTIVAPNASLSLGTIDGIGSNPDMNSAGVAAFQVEFDSSSVSTAIYTGTPGSITLIADTGDTVDGEQVCSIEPFPQINDANQVFWGTSVFDGSCSEDEGRKVIYRFTPPSTHEALLIADTNGPADQVTTSDPDFVSSQTTFIIVDAHLISFGGDVAGTTGGVMVSAVLRPVGDVSGCFSYDDPPCERALLYLGPTAGTISLIALEGANSIFDGAKLKGVANSSAQALFKAQEDDTRVPNTDDASVEIWSSAEGVNQVAGQGQAIPGGNVGTFDGFTSHLDLNEQGNAAFTAGLDIPSNGTGCTADAGETCRGVYFAQDAINGGAVTEIARTTDAAVADPAGDGADSLGGFDFEYLGSVAVIDECNTVYFVAENFDTTCTNQAGAPFSGDDEATGIFAWNNGTLVKVVQEGDVVTGGRVVRLFVPMPELRQHAGQNRFAVRAWLDDDQDCLADVEATLVSAITAFPACGLAPTPTPTNTLVPGQPTNTPTNTPTQTPRATSIPGVGPPEIPALGPAGLWVMIGLLALAGSLYLWRRNG